MLVLWLQTDNFSIVPTSPFDVVWNMRSHGTVRAMFSGKCFKFAYPLVPSDILFSLIEVL